MRAFSATAHSRAVSDEYYTLQTAFGVADYDGNQIADLLFGNQAIATTSFDAPVDVTGAV